MLRRILEPITRAPGTALVLSAARSSNDALPIPSNTARTPKTTTDQPLTNRRILLFANALSGRLPGGPMNR
jgi:hypothetical protein